jgi:hypothetical protein
LDFIRQFFIKIICRLLLHFGIGLAFDPFDTEQKWNDRPTWQKVILVIHLALVAAMFGFGIALSDK